jgi:hypothetical protein
MPPAGALAIPRNWGNVHGIQERMEHSIDA